MEVTETNKAMLVDTCALLLGSLRSYLLKLPRVSKKECEDLQLAVDTVESHCDGS
jgi:hypothetical protein